jgi:molybdopterin converting factor subunit 1
MRISVKLFAILRDRAGAGEITLDLPEGTTAGAVATAVCQRFPELADLAKRSAVALNFEYVPTDTALKNGDEVALIPPVSGG